MSYGLRIGRSGFVDLQDNLPLGCAGERWLGGSWRVAGNKPVGQAGDPARIELVTSAPEGA
jgi:hypothetical protein